MSIGDSFIEIKLDVIEPIRLSKKEIRTND